MSTLFNEDRYHALNLGDGQTVLRAHAHDDSGRVIGELSGVLDGEALVNGFSAPFGGLDLARPRETPANVSSTVEQSLRHFRDAGVGLVRIRLPPACYGENESLIQFTLLNSGFAVEHCELNQHIDLSGLSTPEDYVAQLKSPARRALLRPDGQELRLIEAEADHEWDRAYATLETNRAARGRRLSLSLDYVKRARATLGARVRMFELLDGDRAVAAALVYLVRDRRELVVAWGDGDHGREHSPMNVLAYRVVERALADGVLTLDLGISNEHEPSADGGLVPNSGLVQFKQSVLARIEPRLTLVRELSR
jgi:Acetyltransferase (GNAT) domain